MNTCSVYVIRLSYIIFEFYLGSNESVMSLNIINGSLISSCVMTSGQKNKQLNRNCLSRNNKEEEGNIKSYNGMKIARLVALGTDEPRHWGEPR